jgi:pSer/pThr/pTyr-binding forkhead associated (FHA) protein
VSILSDFEDRIGRGVEGVFAGVFRSPVQPAELARAVAKEMDRRRVVGIGKVYAPTLYNILLSPEDDQQLGGFADTLAGELETYLVSYARERSLSLAARPVVRFIVDDELKLGRFDVIGELLSPDELAEELGEELPDEAPAPPVVRAGLLFDAESEDADDLGAPAPGIATVTVRDVDHDVVLRGDRMVIGRIAGCDICIADANTSRQHAAFVREAGGWAVEDLGSTNGTLVNGKVVEYQKLRNDDVIVVGITELVYHEPRG